MCLKSGAFLMNTSGFSISEVLPPGFQGREVDTTKFY